MIRNLHPKYIKNANDPKRQIMEFKKRKEFQQIFLQDIQTANKYTLKKKMLNMVNH